MSDSSSSQSSGGDEGERINHCYLSTATILRMAEIVQKHSTEEEWREWLKIPLELAGTEGDEKLALELLDHGAGGEVGDPFLAAIQADQYNFVRNLFPKEANPPYRHLRLAVSLGNEAMVSLLLDLGANADANDKWSGEELSTPLLIAADSGHAGIVGLLLDAGASVRPRIRRVPEYDHDVYQELIVSESALDVAAAEGHVDVIKAITRREPSVVNGPSPGPQSGYTPLHYAAKHSQIDCIDALVEAGADLEAKAGTHCGTALHAAVESPDCEATLRALLGHGADIESKMSEDVTPLGFAIQLGNVAVATSLVAAGADVSESLLFCPENDPEAMMVRTLVRLGADVNARRVCDGSTPLHLAAKNGLVSRVDALLKAGGDERAVNDRGEIPADVAGISGHAFFYLIPPVDRIRALLSNAPRDRANRAWSRRGFFMLCRTFPGRVRLQPGISEGRGTEPCLPTPCDSDHPSIIRATKKRTTAEVGGGEEEQLAGGQTEEGAAALREAMIRLMELEADVVFRKIVEFL